MDNCVRMLDHASILLVLRSAKCFVKHSTLEGIMSIRGTCEDLCRLDVPEVKLRVKQIGKHMLE